MGSEGPPLSVLHVTGFKKFHGVDENPTEVIALGLQDYVESKGLPPGMRLGSVTVLETAGDGALSALRKVLDSALPAKTTNPSFDNPPPASIDEQIIWTNIAVSELVDALVEKGYDVALSDDAGRFVCNYVYYQSLCHAAAHGTKCLFVHVPPFSKIDANTQFEFMASLFEILASMW